MCISNEFNDLIMEIVLVLHEIYDEFFFITILIKYTILHEAERHVLFKAPPPPQSFPAARP